MTINHHSLTNVKRWKEHHYRRLLFSLTVWMSPLFYAKPKITKVATQALHLSCTKGDFFFFLALWRAPASLQDPSASPVFSYWSLTVAPKGVSLQAESMMLHFFFSSSLSVMSDHCSQGSLVLTHSLSGDCHQINSFIFHWYGSNIDLTLMCYRSIDYFIICAFIV